MGWIVFSGLVFFHSSLPLGISSSHVLELDLISPAVEQPCPSTSVSVGVTKVSDAPPPRLRLVNAGTAAPSADLGKFPVCRRGPRAVPGLCSLLDQNIKGNIWRQCGLSI